MNTPKVKEILSWHGSDSPGALTIRGGGGFGSIIGRNSFQWSHDQALKFLDRVMTIYAQ